MKTSPGVEQGRYSRQVRFAGLGRAGQERLGQARVLVVGCGALGSAVADMLVRAGVGQLTVVDRDFVELSNLHRQLLYDEADAAEGLPKAVVAARALGRINSTVRVDPVVADVTPVNVEPLVAAAQLVVDGTDNLETRYLLNDACVKRGVPWVYGGAVASTGMVMAVVPGVTACFQCLFPPGPAAGSVATCETAGVLVSTVVAVAASQWTLAVKLLVGNREGAGELEAFDVWTHDHDRAAVPRRPDCPCCQQRRFEFLESRATSRTASLCGRNAVQVSPATPVRLDLAALAGRLAEVGTVSARGEFLLRLQLEGHELTIFPDGRAIVKGTSDLAAARALYARYVGG